MTSDSDASSDFFDEAPDDLFGENPDDVAHVACPYCGEVVELLLDPGGGAVQEYVEDCEVCCQPWQIEVRYEGGTAKVSARTSD